MNKYNFPKSARRKFYNIYIILNIYKVLRKCTLTWSELTDISLFLQEGKEYERNLQKYRIKSRYGNIKEEPLPAGGSCLLGSVNLSEFVDKNKRFNFSEFFDAVLIVVDAMNDVLMEGMSLHPLAEQRESVNNWRQIGIGIMGLADMLIKMEIPYDSEEARDICDRIGYCLAAYSLYGSALRASTYGAFPKYDEEKILKSNFFKSHNSSDIREIIEDYGLANSQLLTIAPTGSISTMLGISGGIEPIFANYYTRKTESLHGEDVYYKVYTPIVDRYMKEHGITDDKDLPKWFVTSSDIHYKNRIKMQSIWQKHIDASISSTVNLPEDTTVKEVEDLYKYAWSFDLKGITVFRNNCKRAGILITSTNTKESTEDKKEPEKEELIGYNRKIQTGCGRLHICAYFNKAGELREVFLAKGSEGGCNNYMISLSRMISLAARNGISIEEIVDQLKSTGACPSYAVRKATKGDTSRGSCCPMAVGNVLLDIYNQIHNNEAPKLEVNKEQIEQKSSKNNNEEEVKGDGYTSCPICGTILRHETGCRNCPDCGWGKCD